MPIILEQSYPGQASELYQLLKNPYFAIFFIALVLSVILIYIKISHKLELIRSKLVLDQLQQQNNLQRMLLFTSFISETLAKSEGCLEDPQNSDSFPTDSSFLQIIRHDLYNIKQKTLTSVDCIPIMHSQEIITKTSQLIYELDDAISVKLLRKKEYDNIHAEFYFYRFHIEARLRAINGVTPVSRIHNEALYAFMRKFGSQDDFRLFSIPQKIAYRIKQFWNFITFRKYRLNRLTQRAKAFLSRQKELSIE